SAVPALIGRLPMLCRRREVSSSYTHALAVGWPPAEAPPRPTAARSNSRCDRTGAPTHPVHNRSAAAVPPTANPPPAHSRVRTIAASGPAALPQPRSSAIPLLPPCPAPVAPAPRPLLSQLDAA